MTPLLSLRRATLLGILVVVSACDIAQFAVDPMPQFEQTWNLPASNNTITIASLLPADNSVSILPDSSGFALQPPTIGITQVVGPQCQQCVLLNGTVAPKPAFTLTATNGATLATDVVSASVRSGTVNVRLTNNMSFDPLRVKASGGPQGYMLIVIHSGSVVFGRDSVNGATTPWPAGTLLNRVIALTSGNAPANLAADVTLNSPIGDSTFINANGSLNASISVPTLTVASVNVNVVNKTLTGGNTQIDLGGLDSIITRHVQSGALEMTITNPLAITGNVNVAFRYGSLPGEVVSKAISLPTGTNQKRTVSLTKADLDNLFGKTVTVTVSGAVNSAAPLTLTPKLRIDIANRLILTIRTGGGQ